MSARGFVRTGRRAIDHRKRWSRRRTLAFVVGFCLIAYWGFALGLNWVRLLLRI